jgi:DNA invertase Pin-like site-specific DNA recombinase
MGGRTELLRLLADAEAGKTGRLFVCKFDRLGRDAEKHVIARQLEEAGAELISVSEGTNQLSRGIQLVAEDYSRQLANRTRDVLVKRFEQGAFTGGVAP